MQANTNLAVQPEKKKLITKLAEKFNVDERALLNSLKSTAFKQKEGVIITDEQMLALMVVADQYNLNFFTKELYAFPDKNNGIVPVVGVDGWTRIVNDNPNFDGVEFVTPDEPMVTINGSQPCYKWIECIIYRKDRQHPTKVIEYLDEVYKPGFKGTSRDGKSYETKGPWQSHTKRMLRHKAFIQCARLAFSFGGIYDEDEAENIIDMGQAKVVPSTRGSDLNKALEQQANEPIATPKVTEHITVIRDDEAEEHFKRTMAAEAEGQA